MWKAKERTGGIRRRIKKEYLKIINASKSVSPKQSISSIQSQASECQFSQNEGSVCSSSNLQSEQNVCNLLNLQNEQNVRNFLDDDGSVRLDNNSSSSDSESDVYEKTEVFRDKIKNWAIDNAIKQTALKDLAAIINEFVPYTLPNDPRTILKTPREISIKQIEGGEYWHNGILKHLKKILLSWQEAPETISLNINFDGLPIFKSSKQEFWPILCNIHENPCFRPFVIGIYFGIGKPKKLDAYLQDFINDIKKLLAEGIHLPESGKKYRLKIRCFVCDSPARAYIKGVCNFNGKHGCQKCVTVGEYSHTSHTVIFSTTKRHDRTDDGFRRKIYGAHHKIDSPLLQLPIDMVKNFPVGDSLHLIDLGIMKRLLIGWRDGNFGKYITKWRASEINTVSIFLETCKLPSEIHRSVRGLDFLAYWKASEFRSFFYYLSIVILPEVLTSKAFSHFLMLYCGVTICSSETYHMYLPLAEKLLDMYVEHYKEFYGADYITSNVHNLLHITAEVNMYGVLHTFSAYPFENQLYMIKRMLRHGKHPLAQVAKRLTEDENGMGINTKLARKNKMMYPFITRGKIETLHFCNFKLSSKTKDKYILTVKNEIIEINSIKEQRNVIDIEGVQLKNKEECFTYPINSSRLGIYKSKSLRTGDTTSVVLGTKEVKSKLVCIPHKEYHYFIPLLHTV